MKYTVHVFPPELAGQATYAGKGVQKCVVLVHKYWTENQLDSTCPEVIQLEEFHKPVRILNKISSHNFFQLEIEAQLITF